MIDIRTILLSYAITNLVCASVMALLWLQNRKRFAGIGFWLGQYAAVFTAIVLLALRGAVPDFLSIVIANALVIFGLILLYMGLERFAGKPGSQIHNYIFLAVFILIHAYFTYIHPSLLARNINASVGIFIGAFQIAWFIFRRVGADAFFNMRGLGVIFIFYCLISIARITTDLITDPGTDFLKTGTDPLVLLLYQTLQIALTLSLFLRVNHRLVVNLERDIAERKQAEAEMENLARFPAENPHPVLRVSRDGNLLYNNQAGVMFLPDWDLVAGKPAPQVLRQAVVETLSGQGTKLIEITQRGRVISFFVTPVVAAGYANLYGSDITERKQAENGLRESEERWRRAIADSPIPIMIHDEDDQVLQLSAGWTKFSGYTIEDISTLADWTERAYGERTGFKKEYIDQLFSIDQTVYNGEWIVAAKDGSKRIWDFQTTPLGKAKGGKRVLHSMAIDITDRKQAEDALRESEEKYRRLFDNANLGIFQSTPEGKAISVNSTFAHMFGYDSPEDALKNIKNVATDVFADPNRRAEIIRLMEKNPDLRTFENVYRRKDGSTFFGSLNTIPIRDSDDRLVRIEGIIEDITERKQAEEATLKSEALYRQAIEVAGAVPYLQSYMSGITGIHYDFIGEGIRQITGYGPEEFNVDLWDSLTQERVLLEDLAGYSFENAISRVRTGSSPIWKCNHRIRARDGKIRWVFEAAVELRDENGVSHGSIGMFQDITERKQAEEEIRNLNAELEQRVLNRTVQLETANKEMEAFSYSVSHDLRAPLRGIDGWSLALLEDYGAQLDEQGKEYIKRVRNETQRMGHLIDEMLQLSRLTRAEMRRERVNLSAIAGTIAARLQESAPERAVEINIQAGISAIGDSHLLEVALSNLLENAFKFTGKRTGARIEFGQTKSQGKRAFFVRDNGAGFDMAYSQKLFGAFQRMHKTSEFPGTGIGLATVQRIIHRHGGRVWAEADVNQGATFYFTLEEAL